MNPMERIRELLSNLEGLTEPELTELRDLCDAQFDERAASDDANAAILGEMDECLQGREAVNSEVNRRETLATENSERLEAMRARAEQLRNPEAEPEAQAEPEAPAAEGAPDGTPPAEEPDGGEPVPVDPGGDPLIPEAVAASGARGRGPGGMIPAMARQGRATPSPTAQQPRFGAEVTAAAGLSHVAPGATFEDAEALAMAMSEKLRRIQSSRDRTQALVASVRWEYPEERQLRDGDARGNTVKLDAVVGEQAPRFGRDGAIVATGGICAPVNVDYSVPTWSTADRPLRDGLPSFQASRGGIMYVTPPDIGVPSLQGGTASGAGVSVGVWTEATDANPAGATKPVWTVACGSTETVYVNAIPTRVQFGNMESRFAPEQVAANTQQAIAVSAREAELELLQTIAQSTKQLATAQYLGATRDVLATIDQVRAQYIYSHRFADNIGLTAIFPAWAKAVLKADLVRETAHDNAGSINVLAITDQQLEDWFTVRGINVVWTMDGLQAGTYGTGGNAITNQFFPLATAGAAPLWPGQVAVADTFMLAWFLFVEGTFQFLDGGQLDLGVVRDSLLDSTNDYETFVEVFEGVAFRGVEAYQVQQMIAPSGTSAGTTTPAPA